VDLDLLVIGSGPGGQRAAVQAAKLGKRVAVVERRNRIGGVSIHTGTIPSKTLRQAILEDLARRPYEQIDPLRPREQERQAARFLMDRTAQVVADETALIREQFRRNDIGLLTGEASFVDPHTVSVDDDGHVQHVSAENVIIAVGTCPARPAGVEFDDHRVIDSDGILKLGDEAPRTMTVVGGGVIGVEYVSMFAALGTKVTLVDGRERLLPYLDDEISTSLEYLLRRRSVTFRLGEEVTAVALKPERVITRLASGKELPSETVLYATGRQGATAGLGLEKIGIEPDKRGRIAIDEDFRTTVRHIFAVGDVAGPPGLAATAMEQGRIATMTAFDEPIRSLPELIPTGIYSIPEISFVGRTEQELTEAAVPYVPGVARWSELAKGLMTRDLDGMLKLLVSTEDRRVLGVHVIGTGATDLVHIGQAVMGGEGTIDFLLTAVFNYPTFAESYKVAALDAMNRINLIS
jgi:NAD(P) transhydrogenase